MPHTPQLLLSLDRSTSQPFFWRSMSQSPKPIVHVPLHTPSVHAELSTFWPEHTTPQPPQLLGLVSVLISQPSASSFMLQSAKPGEHMPLHTPAPHVTVAMLLLEQTLAQPPQLFGSLAMFVLQPFIRNCPSQV